MEIAKGILIVVYFIVCISLIVIALMQSKEDTGAGDAIVGGTRKLLRK